MPHLEYSHNNKVPKRDKSAGDDPQEDVCHHNEGLGRVCPEEEVPDPLAEVRNILEAVLHGDGKVADLLDAADDAKLALVVEHFLEAAGGCRRRVLEKPGVSAVPSRKASHLSMFIRSSSVKSEPTGGVLSWRRTRRVETCLFLESYTEASTSLRS